jgi:hypothetical protein
MHLLVAVLLGRLALVQPLQHAVMLLVEPPALRHGNPVFVHPVQHDVERPDGSFQKGGIGASETETLPKERLSGPGGLRDALFAQIHIGPARKTVLPVPFALAVAEQHDFLHKTVFFD